MMTKKELSKKLNELEELHRLYDFINGYENEIDDIIGWGKERK